MNQPIPHLRLSVIPALLIAGLSGCATQGKPPPAIALDEPVQAQRLPDPPAPVEVVEVPRPLPLPAQMKPLPAADAPPPAPEPADEKLRVSKANDEARIAPTREGYVNAIQVWPFTDGALYQVYTSPGRVTVIALQEGEELVTVSAGDTVRWIVGDTTSGAGPTLRVHVMVKRIGVSIGSSNESWARANLKDSEIVTYDNSGLVFNDLAIGRIDATISSYFGGTKYATDRKLPIKDVGPILTYQLSAAALQKNQPALRAAVSKAVEDMLADGTIDRLSRRWVGVSYKMSEEIARTQRQ